MTLTAPLSIVGTAAIEAAHGKTLKLNTGTGYLIDETSGGFINFGSASDDGVVVWNTPVGSGIVPGVGYGIVVRGGTLKGGSGDFDSFVSQAASIAVNGGAKLDLHGDSVFAEGLHGTGTVIDTGAAAELDIESATFAGTIKGAITVGVFNSVTLTGTGTFTQAYITGGSSLHLSGSAAEDVDFVDVDSFLILDNPPGFSGHVGGFSTGDTIDLPGIDYGGGTTRSYNKNTHVLTVSDGTHTADIIFDGHYKNGNFVLADDGSGGTDVNYAFFAPPPPGEWMLAG